MVMERKSGQEQNVTGNNSNITVVQITTQELTSLLTGGNVSQVVPSLIDPRTGQVIALSSITSSNN